MTNIEWAEPPPKKNNVGKWGPVADELRANPGRWAKIREAAPASAAANFQRGKAFQPAEDFEFRAVRIGGGSALQDVYARFVGEAGA